MFCFAETNILILAAHTKEEERSKSGILTLRPTAHDPLQATYEHFQKYLTRTSGGYGVNCNGRIIIGGGRDSSNGILKNVFEFNSKFKHLNNFKEIQPMNFGRFCSSAIFYSSEYQNIVFII